MLKIRRAVCKEVLHPRDSAAAAPLMRFLLTRTRGKSSVAGGRYTAARASLAREIALRVLMDAGAGHFAEHALSSRLDSESPAPEERAFATELVYGVLRWKKRLDAVLQRCVDRPGKKLDLLLREIFRIAFYQIFMLDGVPDHAIVDQAVTQARHHCGSHTAPFVNAVLRNALRKREDVDPLPQGDPDSLAVYYSHPPWLVRRWIDLFGPDVTRKILIHNNSRAPVEFRVNTVKATRETVVDLLGQAGVAPQSLPDAPDCLRVSGLRGPVRSLPGYQEGFFTVQARASQMIVGLLGIRPGDRILDACAAPGGKTAQLAGLGGKRCPIVAVDIDEIRVEETRWNLQRLGVHSVELRCGDASEPEFVSSLGLFDRILLDAPCSNLGVLRHNPEVKYRVEPEDVEKIAARQRKMLDATAACLKNGGILVYSVCTVTTEETVDVVRSFLDNHTGYTAIRINPAETAIPKFVHPGGFFSTFPPTDDNMVDGFFAARIGRQ